MVKKMVKREVLEQEVALDVASFLDSTSAQALVVPGRADVKKIAEFFLTACYDELGKAPRLLDGQDVHEILGHRMPGHFGRKDPLAEHVPAVLAAYFDHLEETQVVTQTFEIRRALEATHEEFLAAVRSGQGAKHAPPRQEPVVHKVPKLGRNDPCSCGSGKKYKKCHGQNA